MLREQETARGDSRARGFEAPIRLIALNPGHAQTVLFNFKSLIFKNKLFHLINKRYIYHVFKYDNKTGKLDKLLPAYSGPC